MRKNIGNFVDWCTSQKEEFFAIWRKSKHLMYNIDDKTGVAVIANLRTGKTASASANVKKVKGIHNVLGLAWAEYKGETIPTFHQALYNLYSEAEYSFLYDSKEWQIVLRNPYKSNELICVCKDGTVKSFNFYTLVRRVS